MKKLLIAVFELNESQIDYTVNKEKKGPSLWDLHD